MGMSLGGDDDAPMSNINTTPLVDVMLVLLIIFLITVPVVVESVPVSYLIHVLPLLEPSRKMCLFQSDQVPMEPVKSFGI